MLEKVITTIEHTDPLTVFGLIAVSLMLAFYALEDRSPWFVLAFAASCLLASAYGLLQGAWPFALVEAVWSVVALRRWIALRPKRDYLGAACPLNVRNFLHELSTLAHPAGRGDFKFPADNGGCDGCVQFIIESGQQVTIHRLWTPQPGQGAGSRILKTLCALADRHGVEMTLKVLPIGRKPYPMKAEQLEAWYQKFGFEGTSRKMVRRPREVEAGMPVAVSSIDHVG